MPFKFHWSEKAQYFNKKDSHYVIFNLMEHYKTLFIPK